MMSKNDFKRKKNSVLNFFLALSFVEAVAAICGLQQPQHALSTSHFSKKIGTAEDVEKGGWTTNHTR